MADNAASMGAALAFYSAFALAPLLLILSAVAGMVFGPATARQALLAQVGELIGPVGSEAVEHLLDQASRRQHRDHRHGNRRRAAAGWRQHGHAGAAARSGPHLAGSTA